MSRQLFVEAVDLRTSEERLEWSTTWQGKYFNCLGYFFSVYCTWKIFIVSSLFSRLFRFSYFNTTCSVHQSTINIVFDRVGKVDPVTRGLEIAVHWVGLSIDVTFWSQHVSFFLIGCIAVTSIRGLLLTLTKVCRLTFIIIPRDVVILNSLFCHFSFSTLFPVASRRM